jgi:hypothetical protein
MVRLTGVSMGMIWSTTDEFKNKRGIYTVPLYFTCVLSEPDPWNVCQLSINLYTFSFIFWYSDVHLLIDTHSRRYELNHSTLSFSIKTAFLVQNDCS